MGVGTKRQVDHRDGQTITPGQRTVVVDDDDASVVKDDGGLVLRANYSL